MGQRARRQRRPKFPRLTPEMLAWLRAESDQMTRAMKWGMDTSPEGRLQWLLEFIREDLQSLPREQRITYGYRLFALDPSNSSSDRPAGPMPDATLRRLQDEINLGIRGLLAPERKIWKLPGTLESFLSRMNPAVGEKWKAGNRAPRFQFMQRIAPTAAVLLGVAELVMKHGARLWSCTNCQAPLLAVKGQKYCSKPCSQQARDRKRPRKAGAARS